MTHEEYARARRILMRRDPILAPVIRRYHDRSILENPPAEPFPALVRVIAGQQLSTKAAATIHRRLLEKLPGGIATPESLAAITDEHLRQAGMSRQKSAYLRDLSAKVMSGELPIDRLHEMSDDEVIAAITKVKGLGRWSAEMFLMFHLRRLDIWPVGDLAVRRGFAAAWDIPVPAPKQLDALGEPYHPYRSIVAWYCWRAAQRYAGSAASAVTA